jgi:DNA-binding XRE family transcriptional regulator
VDFGKDFAVTSIPLATPAPSRVELALGHLLACPVGDHDLDAPRVTLLAGSCHDHRLGRAIEGCHIRAARGLLDWSMHDLAQASGLSLSTIRRLENGVTAPETSRSHGIAVATLRRAGVGFALLNHTVAIYRL